MATEITMPQMGESIAEGTLTRWFKKPGESVKRDEPLFEISTDKVDAEIPAPADGVLSEIRVEEGTTVEVNTVVGILAEPGTASESGGADASATEPAAEPSAPADAPRTAAAAAETASTAATATAVAPPPRPASPEGLKKTRSSPLVRRIAREHGITDLSAIPGTGVDGRVTKNDILGFIEQRTAPPSPAAQPAAAVVQPSNDVFPSLGLPRTEAAVEAMSNMRRKIAEHMVYSRRTSAHVHSVFEADVSGVVELRQRHKSGFTQRHGVKLTYMPFFMKATVDALREFPWVNASLDGTDIIVHRSVHLGIAVALDNGLIVPVVKNADELNLVGLQKRVTDLAQRARSKALLPEEVQGGTFTITNPGQYGGLFGIPIINQPQVAILGLGGIQKRPVVIEGETGDAIAIRSMVYMCLSYDHRLVDGALADQFMARLKANLENWDEATLG